MSWALGKLCDSQERLDGTNKYRCTVCNTLTEATRSVGIEQLPPVLTLHLNRTIGRSNKVSRLNLFPLDTALHTQRSAS